MMLVTACATCAICACTSSMPVAGPALDGSGAAADGPRADGPVEPDGARRCVFEAWSFDAVGARTVPWVIETDEQGFVRSFRDERVLEPELDREPATWSGRGGPFSVSIAYDDEGRIVRLRRAVAASGELYVEEAFAYRGDGGVALHALTSGPAHRRTMGSDLELIEERRVEGDVELVAELRTKTWPGSGAKTTQRRWTARGADGRIRERIDDGDDGTIDKIVDRVRAEGLRVETLLAADGVTELARQTTRFDADGRPVSRSRDNDGDGVIDLEVTWSEYGARRAGKVVRMAAGSGTDIWEVATVAQETDAEGLFTETVEADEWADGELDYATLTKTFHGQPLKLAGMNKSATVVLMGYELERSCPDVVPRIAAPPFRTRCPFAGRFQSCDLQAAQDEPGEAAF